MWCSRRMTTKRVPWCLFGQINIPPATCTGLEWKKCKNHQEFLIWNSTSKFVGKPWQTRVRHADLGTWFCDKQKVVMAKPCTFPPFCTSDYFCMQLFVSQIFPETKMLCVGNVDLSNSNDHAFSSTEGDHSLRTGGAGNHFLDLLPRKRARRGAFERWGRWGQRLWVYAGIMINYNRRGAFERSMRPLRSTSLSISENHDQL